MFMRVGGSLFIFCPGGRMLSIVACPGCFAATASRGLFGSDMSGALWVPVLKVEVSLGKLCLVGHAGVCRCILCRCLGWWITENLPQSPTRRETVEQNDATSWVMQCGRIRVIGRLMYTRRLDLTAPYRSTRQLRTTKDRITQISQ